MNPLSAMTLLRRLTDADYWLAAENRAPNPRKKNGWFLPEKRMAVYAV
jgi:hypothetical protein